MPKQAREKITDALSTVNDVDDRLAEFDGDAGPPSFFDSGVIQKLFDENDGPDTPSWSTEKHFKKYMELLNNEDNTTKEQLATMKQFEGFMEKVEGDKAVRATISRTKTMDPKSGRVSENETQELVVGLKTARKLRATSKSEIGKYHADTEATVRSDEADVPEPAIVDTGGLEGEGEEEDTSGET